MSTALLQELNQEVRRLYIAGSELAAGDFRLKRLLPQFQQLGERAPVFKRLGEGISALIEPESKKETPSAQLLQDLNQLLSSVLHTQGTTAPEGELHPVDHHPVSLSSRLSFRKLSAVQTALTTTGGGRYEIIEEAWKEGLFRDFRLVYLAIEALNDPYVEIGELAANEILPSYGSEIIPFLMESFNPAGGKSESRKLKVMAQTGGKEIAELIRQAAEIGSDEVRCMAIKLLARYEEYEADLMEWSKSKKKVIREAAYDALAENGSEQAVERLYEAAQGKDQELVNPALGKCRSALLTDWLVRDMSAELQAVSEFQDDKSKLEESWSKVKRCLWALHDKQSSALEELYRNVLQQYSLYIKSLGWAYLMNEAVIYMNRVDSEEARELLRQNAENDLEQYRHSSSYVREVFQKAARVLPPDRVFEQYKDVLLQGFGSSSLGNAAKERKRLLDTLSDMVIHRQYKPYEEVMPFTGKESYTYYVEMLPQEQLQASWDDRWLELFIEQDELALVSAFARRGHHGAESYLLAKLKNSPEFRNRFANLIIMGLVRSGMKDEALFEAIVVALEDKRNQDCYMIEPFIFKQLCRLPAMYYDRVLAVQGNFRDNAEDQLRYILRMMREQEI
ncbi:HEAT repeat domain-containing protein [Paenibacillus sp. p3-SID867]|uniref:HEAT repeat domain-containing protein n=1 Tax=Paenibacillus sp. p3-SID867 TaxID=2916363 RepID=UPI0021A61B26|nr:HEAT repeat domain-containing protein [Paenibacillus sp. p3-SID867]MCT1398958.1 HEAT repeat domain-containing protein [Paenibacillus sp. p3-SID867]